MPTSSQRTQDHALLSQTAAGRLPGGTPWESQPEGGRRFTSHPSRRPTGRYEPQPPTTGTHIQVGGSGGAALARRELFDDLAAHLAGEESVVVLEDIHWADQATLDALLHVELATTLGLPHDAAVASGLTWRWGFAVDRAMVRELEEARAEYEQSVQRVGPLLVRAALTRVAEVVPGTARLEVWGEINEDWIPTLRIQRVLDGDGRVLYDTETGPHAPGVEAQIEQVNSEYLDQLLHLTGDEYLGTGVVEAPAPARS